MGKMKQVICIDTGKIYKSAAACEAELDLKQLISRCCNGTATHPDGLVFRYIEDGKIIEPSAAEVAERKERIKEAKDKYNKKRREKKTSRKSEG